MNAMIIQEAVDSASSAMYGRVQPAVDAIQAAIEKVMPLLDHGTWSGPAAREWIDQWMTQYRNVLNLLSGMPAAEQQVISGALAHAETVVRNMNNAHRPSA